MYSVCVLLYGDHADLAKRCLQSISQSHGQDYVADIRIGLHDVSADTQSVVNDFVSELWPVKVILYEPQDNIYKYPTMRKMFYDKDHPLSKYTMWFDDDSYICADDFWQKLSKETCDDKMLGQIWQLPVHPNQWEWAKTQPWFNAQRPKPNMYKFCQGAWWVCPSGILTDLNWPIPELKHCGGDSLLGEVLAHKGYNLKKYDYGVRINADENGKHSGSKRRGFSEKVIGSDYTGEDLPTIHQTFPVTKTVIDPTL